MRVSDRLVVALGLCLLLPLSPLGAQQSDPLSVETGLTFAHFQQQVKQEVGDPRGQRIVHETEIGLHLAGTYQVLDWLAAGLYIRFDTGLREAARFDGFDAGGRTTVRDRVGGDYNELWLGPLLRGTWRFLQLDVGYGAYGIRHDDGRSDLPSASGDTSAGFRLSPTIAWLVALGVNVPIDDGLDLSLRAEYRARYYFERGGEAIAGDIHHGTQSVVPLIAVRWRPG